MEEVGELHVDGSHGARVLHDPVFVHIGSIVVAGRAGRVQKVGRKVKKKCKKKKNLSSGSTEQRFT